MKNSSGRVRVAKKSSGRVAGTRQTLPITNINAKAPPNIFKILSFPPSGAEYEGHISNYDLAKNTRYIFSSRKQNMTLRGLY